MKKTDVKNIAGGTKTTVTEPDGSKTITYNGVSNLHIGRTFTYGTPSSHNAASTWKQQSSSSTNFSMHSSKDHKTYENEKDYHSSQSTSSFKR
ncbi:MAG TPA: hypothetical protein VGH95_01105 [Candidatus Aquirickettsiella sp.]